MQVPRRVAGLVVSGEDLGESRVLPMLAILTSAALYATLPGRFIIGPSAGIFSAARWVVPVLAVLLLLVLVPSVPKGRLVRSLRLHLGTVRVGARVGVLSVTAIISAAESTSIVIFFHRVVNRAR